MKPYGGTEKTRDRYHTKEYLDKGGVRQQNKRLGWEEFYHIWQDPYDLIEWQGKNNDRLNCNGCCGCCCHTDVPLEQYIIN